MPDENYPNAGSDAPIIYQVRIKGHLGQKWAEWFGVVSITLEDDGNTSLFCSVIDQAALYGLIRKLRDIGAPLISIYRVGLDAQDSAAGDHLDSEISKKE